MIQIKRVYDPSSPHDGRRFLVDRFWPRGIKKEAIEVEAWMKDAAPSPELCHWFSHDPARWDEFRRRYFAQLDESGAAEPLQAAAGSGRVTLVFSARDAEHNNAVALKEYLERRPPS